MATHHTPGQDRLPLNTTMAVACGDGKLDIGSPARMVPSKFRQLMDAGATNQLSTTLTFSCVSASAAASFRVSPVLSQDDSPLLAHHNHVTTMATDRPCCSKWARVRGGTETQRPGEKPSCSSLAASQIGQIQRQFQHHPVVEWRQSENLGFTIVIHPSQHAIEISLRPRSIARYPSCRRRLSLSTRGLYPGFESFDTILMTASTQVNLA
ncbi:hypothetical protein BDP81DRAFT_178987 [Colletotrichum phormii]|uniref:Uncharacterized protein n=1 Tax=Colletotrichum phormii TaxID=359342 RepID=A0AAI9ZWK5_9PEZI|nr:uncharacterized protein BDP81DRAFT_178987 [Colletotrichum phormii]KAK1639537.1 hypothetical protein BDP81DRAFT_178987 [Colletotrichum phormii]